MLDSYHNDARVIGIGIDPVGRDAKWRSSEKGSPALVGITDAINGPAAGRLESDLPVIDIESGWYRRIRAAICPQELKRRLLHSAPGLFPYVYYFCPQDDPLAAWSLWVVTLTCGVVALGSLILARVFRREGERDWTVSVLSFAAIIPILLWSFPGQSEIACGVVSIIAFGDSFATAAGLVFGGPSLPWNPAKSWAGSAAFVAGSLPFAVFSFWIQSHPTIELAIAFACVAPAVLFAAIAESLSSRINDNIRVGIVAALTIVIMQTVLVGW